MADGDGKLSDEVELRLRDEEGSVACVDGRQSKLISDVAGGGEVDSGLLKCRDGGEGTDVALVHRLHLGAVVGYDGVKTWPLVVESGLLSGVVPTGCTVQDPDVVVVARVADQGMRRELALGQRDLFERLCG